MASTANEIIDSVRKIIFKWVNTQTPLSAPVLSGSTEIPVKHARRFQRKDNILVTVGDYFENNTLSIKKVDEENNILYLDGPVLNDYTDFENTVIRKAPGWQLVQGIYFGDHDVIPKYPAITVYCKDRPSEWLTLGSTKETFNVEINIYALASTKESGVKLVNTISDTIVEGLKSNIMPLVDDYDLISLKDDAKKGDFDIVVNNRDMIGQNRRCIIENPYYSQENFISYIYSEPGSESVKLKDPLMEDYDVADTSIIIPYRHIYNSWPTSVNYGNTMRNNDLLRAATITWFAEEQQLQSLPRYENKLS